jgi:hypothetical protein
MDARQLFDLFIANLPTALTILGMLGMYKVLAAVGRKLWGDVQRFVKKTPNKIDDAAVSALDPGVKRLFDLIEIGDLPAIRAQATVVEAKLRARTKR